MNQTEACPTRGARSSAGKSPDKEIVTKSGRRCSCAACGRPPDIKTGVPRHGANRAEPGRMSGSCPKPRREREQRHCGRSSAGAGAGRVVEWSVGDTRGRAGGGLHWAAGSTAEFNPDSVFDELCVLVTALSLLPAALPGVL